MPFDQTKYITGFIKENYDQVMIKVPKGKKNILKKTADQHNTNVNRMFIEAVEEKYKIDLTSKE